MHSANESRRGGEPLLKLFLATLLLLVTNVLVSVLVVAVYATVVEPGRAPAYYQDFAETSSPYSSILAGMPLMFALCWWLNRWPSIQSSRRAAVIVWGFYVVLDIGITAAYGPMTTRIAGFTGVSLLTKLGAGLLGAKVGSNRPR